MESKDLTDSTSMVGSVLNAAKRNDFDTKRLSDRVPGAEQEGASERQEQWMDTRRVVRQTLPGRAPVFQYFPYNGNTTNDALNAARRYSPTNTSTSVYPYTQNTTPISYCSPAVEIVCKYFCDLTVDDRRALSEP